MELQSDRDNEVAAVFGGVENAVTIGKTKFVMCESAKSASGNIVNVNADEGVGDFLAVGADVLDGGGASEAGDFTESFDASEAFIHGVFYDVVPIFAAHDFEANR